MGISGMFFALRSRVAGLGFLGLGAALGLIIKGVAEVVLAGVMRDGLGDAEGLGVADELLDSDGLGVADERADSDGLGEVSVVVDSDAVALVVFTLRTPTKPPATSANASRAMTGRVFVFPSRPGTAAVRRLKPRGSFTTKVCHETHKTGVPKPPSCLIV